MNNQKPTPQQASEDTSEPEESQTEQQKKGRLKKETGGPQGPEPTRYGDWESKGRCIDF